MKMRLVEGGFSKPIGQLAKLVENSFGIDWLVAMRRYSSVEHGESKIENRRSRGILGEYGPML